jgi:hypothetical protein
MDWESERLVRPPDQRLKTAQSALRDQLLAGRLCIVQFPCRTSVKPRRSACELSVSNGLWVERFLTRFAKTEKLAICDAPLSAKVATFSSKSGARAKIVALVFA